jgi:uncharacterized protein with HEPN domain
MLPDKRLKYMLDILQLIEEQEEILKCVDLNFTVFQTHSQYIRATERILELIGEAVGRLCKLDSEIEISEKRKIIATRNLLAHSYDSINPALLWAIAVKNLPVLKEEIKALMS